MDANQAQHAGPKQALCPFLRPAQAEWIYPVQGFCRGLPRGLLMIPSVEEYRTRCSTEAYTACPIYRSRTAGDRKALDAWLRVQYQNWGPPAGGAADLRRPEDAAPAGACAGRPSTPAP